MRGAKRLAYFLAKQGNIAKLIQNFTGQIISSVCLSEFCLSVAQFCVRLYEITIKASDLRFAAKCRHQLPPEVLFQILKILSEKRASVKIVNFRSFFPEYGLFTGIKNIIIIMVLFYLFIQYYAVFIRHQIRALGFFAVGHFAVGQFAVKKLKKKKKKSNRT